MTNYEGERIEMEALNSKANSSKNLGFVALSFFIMLPYLIEYYATIQEAGDFLTSFTKPSYLLNKIEEFDFIIG